MAIAKVFLIFVVLWHNCLANATVHLPASTKDFEDGLVYSFINVGTGLALDVYNVNQANGAVVGTFTPNGKNNQKWRAIKADAGWQLKSLIGNNKCLDQEEKTKPKLQQWDCWSGFNQRWYTREVLPGSTMYNIVCLSSSHVITAHGINGQPVTMEAEQRGNARQQWVLKRV